MKKEKLITRTIVVSNCEFMTVDVETANVEIVTAELTGKISKDEALKQYKSTAETDTFKVVACQSIDYTENLYGMSENEFIAHAKILPPRKATETEETEVVEE